MRGHRRTRTQEARCEIEGETGVTYVEFVVGEPSDPKLPKHAFDSIMISNAYHEFTHPRPMLRHIREALKPGGKLVVLEAITPKMRDRGRDEQVKAHELAPAILEGELEAAGSATGAGHFARS